MNRRHALQTMLAAGTTCLGLGLNRVAFAAAPGFEVRDIRSISQPTDRYYGWPTLAKRANGELLVVASGGRHRHVCPFGRVDLIQSADNGDSWTFARTIYDGPIDDRDAGLIETPNGTLLATTFTSLAYLPTYKKALEAAGTNSLSMSADELAQWKGAHGRLPEGEHEKHLGSWMIRSEDGGISWGSPYRVPLNSPHGPVVISKGRLLYAGKALWTDDNRVGVCQSTDDGRTWQWLSDIPTREGDNHREYHELHAVEAASGRLIVQIRNHNSPNAGETLQSHSDDGGQTWTVPRSIGVWGLPSHLLKLQDGRLLMSYGHRRAPLGIQVRLSEDNGDSWSEPIILYGDGASGDLGYPSTIQFDDDSLCTVWYEVVKGSPLSQLRAARWKLV
ncbi:MAG: exo-alpha-sialidase [Planctomycetaceae bacterium]|nr:exo-alpha-sialidase [Planctomycetaceae bacterium]